MRVSKLETLKDWLSIADAAKRLSVSTGKDISEADILRLGLDSHLTLSVYFVNPVKGNLRDIKQLGKGHWDYGGAQIHKTAEEIQAWFIESLDKLQAVIDRLPAGWDQDPELVALEKDDDEVLNLQRLEGVWDLPMLGEEALDVKREYHRLTEGLPIRQMCFGGPLVKKHNKPEVFEIFSWDFQERHYCHATTLLNDGMLVVRTAVLREFEGRLRCSKKSADGLRPSHLLVIAGLLELLMDDRLRRYNQGSAADAIKARHPDWRGISARNLAGLFAESKAAVKDANKEAQTKADAAEGVKPPPLLVIAGLLELLMDDSRSCHDQDSVVKAIMERHHDWQGFSARNLVRLFDESKAAANDADKDVQAKADARQASGSRMNARKATTV